MQIHRIQLRVTKLHSGARPGAGTGIINATSEPGLGREHVQVIREAKRKWIFHPSIKI